jgi:6-phosphogluconolactonase
MNAPDPKPSLVVYEDAAALADGTACWLGAEAQNCEGRFRLCLSGGSTPKALYHRLTEPPYRETFPWARTALFWGDERFVPQSDPLSNYRMVREALLDQTPFVADQVHPMPTEGGDPEAAARSYQQILQTLYGAEDLDPARPLFNVVLLGLGEDGHTASLFPNTKVLKERTRWVAAVVGAKAEARITLTYPALDSSRHAVFLVSGEDKAEMLRRLCADDQALPAAHVHPLGERHIFCDRAAASRLA